MRVVLVSLILTAIATAVPVSAQALSKHYNINIPRESLDAALKDFAHQTGFQVVRFAEKDVGEMGVGPLSGDLSVQDALQSLLAPRGLTYQLVNERTIAIVADPALQSSSQPGAIGVTQTADLSRGEKSFGDRFRLAQVDQGASTSPASVTTNEPAFSAGTLEEVIVTAQKREERLQDVPVPVTTLNADLLVSNGQTSIQDYFTSIPGLGLQIAGNTGTPQISIRGLATATQEAPTVATTVDGVPFGSPSALAFGWAVPDLDPSDLARVEVLRGPQGTLYGASSLGGLINYVTIAPSTTVLSGHVDVGMETVQNASDLGYVVRGGINIPLSDTLAIRASGYERFDPGYVDNIETDERGVNKAHSGGGHLAALWRPSDTVSLQLSALLQHRDRYGSPFVDTINPYIDPVAPHTYSFAGNLGDLDQSRVRASGYLRTNFQAYSAKLSAKVGGVDLTSITAYGLSKNESSTDLTYALGPYVQYGLPQYGLCIGPQCNGFGVPGDPDNSDLTDSKWTEELRASGWAGDHFEWLVGGFFEHDAANENQYLLASDPVSGATAGTFLHDIDPSTYQELAGFFDLTYHFNDKFDVQVGAREAQIKQSYQETFIGTYNALAGLPSPYYQYPFIGTKENAFTYLVTPRFKISSDLMVYARLASGYRPGGPNIDSVGANAPLSYKHDSTRNYEVGVKGNTPNHLFSFDASAYYIDWTDIQLSVPLANGAVYEINGSRAKSQGIELSGQAQPVDGLTIAAWVSLDDAKLTEPFPPGTSLVGTSGDRLPYVSRFTGSISVDQRFPITRNVTGFAGGVFSYVGDSLEEFPSPGVLARPRLSPYAKTDLRTGVNFNQWTVNLYANNVANKRAEIWTNATGTTPGTQFVYIQPRTLGITLSKVF